MLVVEVAASNWHLLSAYYGTGIIGEKSQISGFNLHNNSEQQLYANPNLGDVQTESPELKQHAQVHKSMLNEAGVELRAWSSQYLSLITSCLTFSS